MQAIDALASTRDSMTVRTVFGEPITQNGVTVVPVARVRGAGGGGHGEGPAGSASEPPDGTAAEQPAMPAPAGKRAGKGTGEGLGFSLRATPVGVFIIKDGKVSWQPAVDVNRLALGGQIVGAIALLTIRAIVKARGAR
jgi:uncharacterized spore protein YtfJ